MSGRADYVECTFSCEQCPFPDCVCTKFMSDRAYMMKGYMKGIQQPDNEADNLPITGERFRELRKEQKVRQCDAAFFARISTTTLCAWERGRRPLNKKQYQNLASVYPWMPPIQIG